VDEVKRVVSPGGHPRRRARLNERSRMARFGRPERANANGPWRRTGADRKRLVVGVGRAGRSALQVSGLRVVTLDLAACRARYTSAGAFLFVLVRLGGGLSKRLSTGGLTRR
jgi:hypothetical protein